MYFVVHSIHVRSVYAQFVNLQSVHVQSILVQSVLVLSVLVQSDLVQSDLVQSVLVQSVLVQSLLLQSILVQSVLVQSVLVQSVLVPSVLVQSVLVPSVLVQSVLVQSFIVPSVLVKSVTPCTVRVQICICIKVYLYKIMTEFLQIYLELGGRIKGGGISLENEEAQQLVREISDGSENGYFVKFFSKNCISEHCFTRFLFQVKIIFNFKITKMQKMCWYIEKIRETFFHKKPFAK